MAGNRAAGAHLGAFLEMLAVLPLCCPGQLGLQRRQARGGDAHQSHCVATIHDDAPYE
jgi:hypothetical protein